MRVVGCDPSTVRCALADNTGKVASVLLYSKEENGRRLSLSYGQIRTFAAQFCHPKPGFVVVEQASGRHVSRSLVEMIGVTRAAIYTALEVPVFLMPPSMWKKAIGLGGNASKDEYCEWARGQGYTFTGDDEAAALGIAQAAFALHSVKPALSK